MVHEIFGFLKVVFICIAGLVALMLVLMSLPRSPLRDFVLGLTQRVGATATALAFLPPMDTIPVAGEVYDLVALIGVAYYWYTFFKKQQIGQTPGAVVKVEPIVSSRSIQPNRTNPNE